MVMRNTLYPHGFYDDYAPDFSRPLLDPRRVQRLPAPHGMSGGYELLPYIPEKHGPPRTVLYGAISDSGAAQNNRYPGGEPDWEAAMRESQRAIQQEIAARNPWYNQPAQLDRYEARGGYRHIYAGPGSGLTIENDERNAPSPDRAIDGRLAKAVEAVAEKGLDFNINSTVGGKHTGSVHYDGLATDINVVDKKSVVHPEAKRQVDALVSRFQLEPEVDRIFGPYYNGIRDAKGNWQALNPNFPRHREIINGHKSHIHVGVRRR